MAWIDVRTSHRWMRAEEAIAAAGHSDPLYDLNSLSRQPYIDRRGMYQYESWLDSTEKKPRAKTLAEAERMLHEPTVVPESGSYLGRMTSKGRRRFLKGVRIAEYELAQARELIKEINGTVGRRRRRKGERRSILVVPKGRQEEQENVSLVEPEPAHKLLEKMKMEGEQKEREEAEYREWFYGYDESLVSASQRRQQRLQERNKRREERMRRLAKIMKYELNKRKGEHDD